jgi:hypothetical protein
MSHLGNKGKRGNLNYSTKVTRATTFSKACGDIEQLSIDTSVFKDFEPGGSPHRITLTCHRSPNYDLVETRRKDGNFFSGSKIPVAVPLSHSQARRFVHTSKMLNVPTDVEVFEAQVFGISSRV